MGNLIPHWGRTPQPRKSCYTQRWRAIFLVLFNASKGLGVVCRADENVSGDKDKHLMSSILAGCISDELPACVKNMRIPLHFASYFSLKFLMCWTAEILDKGWFKRASLSFVVPGKTKCAPELMFAVFAQRFCKSDTVTTKKTSAFDGCNYHQGERSITG